MKTLRETIEEILDEIKGTVHEANEIRADNILSAIKDAMPKEQTLKDNADLLDYGMSTGWNAYRNDLLKRIGDSPHRKI